MGDNTQQATAEVRGRYLSMLADELTRRGFKAEVRTSRTGVPLVYVVNPAATVLSETIHCAQLPDGSLWFAWPWRMRIAAADETPTAADEVAQVLGTRE